MLGSLLPEPRIAVARAWRRWGFGMGPRLVLLLLLGLLWLVPAWWDRRALYGLLAWDVLLLAVFAWDLRRLQRARPEASRIWTAAPALSTAAEVRIELRNLGEIFHITAQDDVPASLRRIPPKLEFQTDRWGEARGGYQIEPWQRGDIQVGALFLRCQSRWRIAEWWLRADLAQTLRIYPNLGEAKRHMLYLLRSRQIELERRLTRRRGLGREFESLRDYRDGDELRDVCWTATARRGKLITRQFQIERSQAVCLVVDAGRLLRARVGKLQKLDFSVNAALTLAHVALYSGDRVVLLAYGRRVQQQLPPGRGSPHVRALVEQLSLVHSEVAEADHARAARVLLGMQKRRSLVVWITDLAETAMTPEVIQAALQVARRHLLV
ncbi:MAG TPA: DUF58 domain-containing protein, partial [Terriglobales bacterium]|nr:DUF58 domain-containing protein [Terriglobales bacterium]